MLLELPIGGTVVVFLVEASVSACDSPHRYNLVTMVTDIKMGIYRIQVACNN